MQGCLDTCKPFDTARAATRTQEDTTIHAIHLSGEKLMTRAGYSRGEATELWEAESLH